ncbi:Receptor-like kinase, partial [Thalictrum thalictroides]
AWRLWNEDKSMEMVDQFIINSCDIEDILRCIHIGLLCVQEGTDQRPTMSYVVLMVSSATIVLPKPQPPPAFYIGRNPIKANSSCSDKKASMSNDITKSLVDGR